MVAARSEQELDALATEIVAAGGEALPAATDVTEPASVQALVERTAAAYGRLDCAFNNAGLPAAFSRSMRASNPLMPFCEIDAATPVAG